MGFSGHSISLTVAPWSMRESEEGGSCMAARRGWLSFLLALDPGGTWTVGLEPLVTTWA
jgi:hypothetical protein